MDLQFRERVTELSTVVLAESSTSISSGRVSGDT